MTIGEYVNECKNCGHRMGPLEYESSDGREHEVNYCPGCGEPIRKVLKKVGDEPAIHPIVMLSDGPRFVLADGSVLSLVVKRQSWDDELNYLETNQGEFVYGFSDEPKVGIRAFDAKPSVTTHPEVQEVLEYYVD